MLDDLLFMEVCCGSIPNISIEVRNELRNMLMDPVYIACSHPEYPEGTLDVSLSNHFCSVFLIRNVERINQELYISSASSVWLDTHWGLTDVVENHIGVLDVGFQG